MLDIPKVKVSSQAIAIKIFHERPELVTLFARIETFLPRTLFRTLLAFRKLLVKISSLIVLVPYGEIYSGSPFQEEKQPVTCRE